jgi:regulatory protein
MHQGCRRFFMGVKMFKVKVSLKARALRYLSMREHSRLELGRKLSRYAEEADDVPALLDVLVSAQFLSEERFSASLVRRRQARFGNQRILLELQSHHIEKTEIEKIKSQLIESEAVRAIEVLHRKYRLEPADHIERAKQMQFLQKRGFSGGAIQAAMRAKRDNEDGDA